MALGHDGESHEHDRQALRRRFVFNLRRLMARRGLSVEDLASFAGVKRQSIYPLLRGAQAPTLDRVGAIADALGCDVLELLAPRPRRGPRCSEE